MSDEKKKRVPAWLRIPMKILLWVVIVVALIPVLIYIPPVQDFLKDVACKVASDATGMKISVGKFRLVWPLDVALDDVNVLDTAGDTMVNAKSVIADVKLLPLLKKDIDLNRLKLIDGYYRMVSPDSSMIMTVDAGLLDVDGKSSFDLNTMHLNLNEAQIKDGCLSLYMDVWKKKPTEEADTASTPFLITANRLKLDNFSFAMSMLPTIDTLSFNTEHLQLENARVDLANYDVSAGSLVAETGKFTYITPTPEYIKTHPAPIDTISPPSPPMTIRADSVALDDFSVLYAVKGAMPTKGFDPSYISIDKLGVSVRDFYNRETEIKLPVTRLLAHERSGLQILSGSCMFGMDSIGMKVVDAKITTPNSKIYATADVPFALMEMNPTAKMAVSASADIGLRDAVLFMPDLQKYVSALSPARNVTLDIKAAGSLNSLNIGKLYANIPSVLNLSASGFVDNPTDLKRLRAKVDFSGGLKSPKAVAKFVDLDGISVPSFTIKGHAIADRQNYSADFRLLSSAGNVNADGKVSLNSERYNADVNVSGLNVAHIMPELGVGVVDGHIVASGAGFNPTKRGAATDVSLAINSLGYGKHVYNGVKGKIGLHDGVYDLDLVSTDPDAAFDIKGSGTIAPDSYTVDLDASIKNLDLEALGFSPTESRGFADLHVSGSASPEKWLYDLDASIDNFEWNLPDEFYYLPSGVKARVVATEENVALDMTTDGINMDFTSPTGLKEVVDKFMAASESVQKQLEDKSVDFKVLEDILPEFALNVDIDGNGLARQLLSPLGYDLRSLNVNLTNADSLLNGNVSLMNFDTGSLALDTVTLAMKTRGSLLDYRLHIGNTTDNLPEFATVDMNGYVGGNRGSASLTQKNSKGVTGYRLGFTAALADSTVTVHFTPLKATIAYMPWTFNLDNHIDYTFGSNHVDANLVAQSLASSIMVKTDVAADGGDALHVNLNNINVQDFLGMNISGAPPIKATIDSDIELTYRGTALSGNGTLDISSLEYDGTKIGDLSADFNAGVDFNGDTKAMAALKINGQQALVVNGLMKNGEELNPNDFSVDLTDFPLSLANAFLDKKIANVEGTLNGHMTMDGTFDNPKLNGNISFSNAAVNIAMLGSKLTLGDAPVTVVDNVVTFKDFDIKGMNENPLTVSGTFDARKLYDMRCNMSIDGDNFQLVNSSNRKRSDIYGKLFLNLHATAKGQLSRLDVNGKLDVLSSSDVFYTLAMAENALTQSSKEGLVTFVNLADTTAVAPADSTVVSAVNMRVRAGVTIQPGARVTVNLKSSGSDKVVVNPSGTLNYYQNYMGDMTLNGTLQLGEGQASYTLPVVGEKKFVLDPGGYVQWSGAIMNPTFNVKAYDNMKVNVNDSGNSRLVNFVVTLLASGNLEQPKISFDLSADGDMSIENELQSMSPDQRSNQAMNLLLYGQYTGPNTSTVTSNLGETALYNFLTSQINSWAANHIKGVDLTFGIDQYKNTVDGQTSSAMSYSYQVSKSLLNNRFKIVVGGNYSTDASADDNFAENLLSDISFEYLLKQSNNLTMLVKLFRQYNYESILEGQVSETGVGFVMRRRMDDLRRFFKVRWGKEPQIVVGDSLTAPSANDSLPAETKSTDL